MEFNRVDEKTLARLPAQNVDTGMGLERTVCILQGKKSVYDTEAFGPIIMVIEKLAGYSYRSDGEKDRSLRIIADHIRTATFILGDPKAVMPSNVGAGYVLRRIIRRAVRHGRKLGIEGAFLASPAAAVVDNVFLLTGLPLLAAWALWRRQHGQRVFTPAVGVLIAVAALIWTVVRNVPGFPLMPTILGT